MKINNVRNRIFLKNGFSPNEFHLLLEASDKHAGEEVQREDRLNVDPKKDDLESYSANIPPNDQEMKHQDEAASNRIEKAQTKQRKAGLNLQRANVFELESLKLLNQNLNRLTVKRAFRCG